MIGLLRFVLALAVIVSHLNPSFSPSSGVMAVFGFYTVSGYLITRVLDTTYRARVFPFLINRVLRIYPAYFVVALVGLGIALAGGTPLTPAIVVPDTLDAGLRQITIFGLLQFSGSGYPIRLVPPAWSLNMELAWYLAMIVLSKRVGWWLLAGICIAAVLVYRGDFGSAYGAYYGPTLCFALGAAVYRYKLQLSSAHVLPAFACLFLLVVAADVYGPGPGMLYASSLATAYALACIDFRHPNFAVADRWLGDLAYPMFLCHWHVAALMSSSAGWPLLLKSLPAIIAASTLMVLAVERPMEKIRNLVRPARSTTAAKDQLPSENFIPSG